MHELLLVIDFINDIVHPEGKIASSAAMVEACGVIEQANAAIAVARAHRLPVVHVKVGFSADYIECPEHSPIFGAAKKNRALELGTWGTAFHDAMDVLPEDCVLVKHRISALYATGLATILDAKRIKRVMICGVATNMTIESTARELHDRGFAVGVLANACAAANSDIHQASLRTLARMATVIDVQAWQVCPS